MMLQRITKQIGLKVAGLSTLGMIFISGVVLALLHLVGISRFGDENFFTVVGIVLFMCICLQCLFILLTVSLLVNRPLSRLSEAMRSVEEGNVKIDLPLLAHDEIGDIGQRLSAMVESLRDMSAHRERIQQRLSQVEENLRFKTALEEKAKIIERMNNELASAFSDLSLLYTVSQHLSSVLEVKELGDVVLRFFTEHFLCERFALFYSVADSSCLRLDQSKGFDLNSAELIVPIGRGLVGSTAEKKRLQFLEKWPTTGSLSPFGIESQITGSTMALPLKIRDELIGVLVVSQPLQRHFRPTDRQALESVANQIATAYDRCRLYMKTKDLSVRDELTGIYNRRYFQQMLRLEIKRAARFKHPVSILMIDVDHFKEFNDAHGHLKGDMALKQLTLLIKSNIREVDVFARYGGEEFVLLLVDTGLNEAVKVAEKLREIVHHQLVLKAAGPLDEESRITISVGVSSYPECCEEQVDLIRTADSALYRAKNAGRDCVVFHQEEPDRVRVSEIDKDRLVH